MGGQHADVIVVGGGLAGCSVAAHVAAAGRRVVVLEQGAQLGTEAAAQNAGMVRRLGEDPFERALAFQTSRRLSDNDWLWEGEGSPSRVTGAVLGLAHDPLHLHDAVAHLRAQGVVVEDVERPGDVAPALAGCRLQQTWFVPDERVADAHMLIGAFARALRRHGGHVHCKTMVQKLLVERGRVVGVDTAGQRLFADQVVLAAGAWSARLAAGMGLHRPLLPIRRTLLHSAPHPLSQRSHPWCWIDDEGVYVRPEGEGWLLSGCDEAVASIPHGPGSTGAVDPELRALALDKVERLMPALSGLGVVGGWSGLRTFAPDRRPVLGQDGEIDGLWWAAGLGGFGVTCSLAVGEVLAAWMAGQTVPWFDEQGVRPSRRYPGRWPIRPSGALHRPRLVSSVVNVP